MDAAIRDWLLDSDPAIRWQVLSDLDDAPPDQVASERARVATEGWGARILTLQGEDGNWGGGSYTPKWTSTTYTMLLLRHFGIDPKDPAVRSAIDRVRDQVKMGSRDYPFFEYSFEQCITGMALALGSYFLDDPRGLPQPELFLERQRADGGWNCKVKSDRSSFNTTITGLEALLEYERAVGGDSDLAEARARAHEYLLQRRLMYSLTTGELINAKWLMMSFPPRWFYDVLRALDYMADAGLDPDPRLQEPIEVIMSKRFDDGTWPVQNWHSGKEHFRMEPIGKPSRWNTLRVLRVLRWYQRD
jgi:hypothetical protein